ncbi:MAG: DUF4270 family protein [Sediminibacterium sp.]|nr:DUF4270 family protein [Sediminibacterium sp.]
MTTRNTNRPQILLIVALFFSIVSACEKVSVGFGDTVSSTDPNLTYIDNYSVELSTYKPDSFLTSSHQVFSIGYHADSDFGIIRAGSFAQINLPVINPLADINAEFDSLEIILKPTGQFYGDSSSSMKITIYRLTENIKNDFLGDYYYNSSSFAHDPVLIGQKEINLSGRTGTEIHIKLSDALGKELLNKFRSGHTDISTEAAFLNYFKGIYITTDSLQTNTIGYFKAHSDSVLLRLNYKERGLYTENKLLNFSFTSAKQFNQINFRKTNAKLSDFEDSKTQLIDSRYSGDQAFFHSSMSSKIKISFPDLLNLKELHPYIKIIKAVLVIKPDPVSFSRPYQLPTALNLYSTDETNTGIAGITDVTSTGTLQTGNLYIDGLFGENTNYSYDITSFITAKMAEGRFSTSALLLTSAQTSIDAATERLILNNQRNKRPIQLKLYVLGL